jgi:hypothetical protein
MKDIVFKSEPDIHSFINLYKDSYIDNLHLRKKEKDEIKIFMRYFKYYWEDMIFEYPCVLIFNDAPDVRIESIQSRIGIEITKSIPEQLAEAENIKNNNALGSIIEPDCFRPGSKRKIRNEIIQCIAKSQQQVHGLGYNGNGIENDFLELVYMRIRDKNLKLSNGIIKRFEKNWLLIMNQAVSVSIDTNYIISELRNHIEDKYNRTNNLQYDRIIIIDKNR